MENEAKYVIIKVTFMSYTKEKEGITMKKKIVKIILIIVLIALILFLTITMIKASVIYKYSGKLKEYQETNNFYAKFKVDDTIEEMWRKEDIGITKVIKDNKIRMICTKPGETRLYMEDGNSKKVSITKAGNNDGAFLPVIEYATFYTENFWQAFTVALTARMTTEEVNGKECYKIFIQEDFQVYINKENLLNVKEINGNSTRELLEYELNTLKEEDVTFPSLEEYEVSNY